MSRRLVSIRMREDDLRLLGWCTHEWGSSLLAAAYNERTQKYDAQTRRSAERYMAAAARLHEAMRAAGVMERSDPLAGAEMVPVEDLLPRAHS